MGIIDSPLVSSRQLAPDARRRPSLVGPLPSVTTSPPAIGYSSGGAVTAITDPVEVDIDDATKIRRWGTQSFTEMVNVDYLSRPYIQGTTIGPEFPVWAFALITDAPLVDIIYLGSAGPSYRLIVDGSYVTQYAATASGGSGQQHRLKVTFPSRKLRHVVVESASLFVSGITVSAIDTVFAPPAAPLKIAFMGDSYTANNGVDGIAPTVAKMLGADWIVNGSGGTGYNNSQGGSGGKQKFLDRLPGLLAADPDYLVTLGGINDGTGTFAADVAAYNAAVAAAGLAATRHIVFGPWDPPSAPHSTIASKSAILASAAAAVGSPFVDVVSWLAGTGTSSDPAGDGPADVVIGVDTTHPVAPDGYIHVGARVAMAIAPYVGGVR